MSNYRVVAWPQEEGYRYTIEDVQFSELRTRLGSPAYPFLEDSSGSLSIADLKLKLEMQLKAFDLPVLLFRTSRTLTELK